DLHAVGEHGLAVDAAGGAGRREGHRARALALLPVRGHGDAEHVADVVGRVTRRGGFGTAGRRWSFGSTGAAGAAARRGLASLFGGWRKWQLLQMRLHIVELARVVDGIRHVQMLSFFVDVLVAIPR